VREQEVALELLEIGGSDRLVFEFAEAGGDTVLGRGRLPCFPGAAIVCDDACDELLAGSNAIFAGRIDGTSCSIVREWPSRVMVSVILQAVEGVRPEVEVTKNAGRAGG